MEENWDHLIVLDACRFDYFSEINNINGRLEKKESRGSSTTGWIRRNFTDEYPDTVYVSGNAHISKTFLKEFLGFNPFYKIIEVWDKGWDEELNAVPPAEINKHALIARDLYPDKKLIIHYQQPHFPSIGERNIPAEWAEPYYRQGYEKKWELEEIKEEYRESLRKVLKKVKKLLKNLEGKIVVTSDHGQCFGEFGIYEHPYRIYIPPLIEIPWLVIRK